MNVAAQQVGFVPPLRFAIRWCIDLSQGAPVLAETVAIIAQVAQDRAKSYCSILVAGDALKSQGAGYVRGVKWDEWAESRCKTRPKTTGAAGGEMDQMRRTLCANIIRLRIAKGWTPAELARQAGVARAYVFRAEQRYEPPPAVVLIVLARALGTTIEQLGLQPASLETRLR